MKNCLIKMKLKNIKTKKSSIELIFLLFYQKY